MDMSLIASKAHACCFICPVCQDKITAHRIAKIENANEISHHTIEAFKRGMTRWLQLQDYRHMRHMLASLRTWRPKYAKGMDSFWGNALCSFVKLQIFRIWWFQFAANTSRPFFIAYKVTHVHMSLLGKLVKASGAWWKHGSWWLRVPPLYLWIWSVFCACSINLWKLTHMWS